MTAFLHDLGVSALFLLSMWAVCSVIREDIERSMRARRIYRAWCRRG
jgi:hypothetical protein